MMRRYAWLLVALALLAAWTWWQQAPVAPGSMPPQVATPGAQRVPGAQIPSEAIATLQQIRQGGPFRHRQDGGVFQNRERLLPSRPRGYYREYTVATPGSRDRGARRIVSGGDPPSEYFYTDDHYRSFRRVDPASGRLQ